MLNWAERAIGRNEGRIERTDSEGRRAADLPQRIHRHELHGIAGPRIDAPQVRCDRAHEGRLDRTGTIEAYVACSATPRGEGRFQNSKI